MRKLGEDWYFDREKRFAFSSEEVARLQSTLDNGSNYAT